MVMINIPINPRFTVVLIAVAIIESASGQQAKNAPSWPHPIPCRIQDGSNPDLFVMTLGKIETLIADGIFDPVKDIVVLKDGSARTNYYRDTLGVKFYQPLDKSRYRLPPSG